VGREEAAGAREPQASRKEEPCSSNRICVGSSQAEGMG
jgi:hypothetical protein